MDGKCQMPIFVVITDTEPVLKPHISCVQRPIRHQRPQSAETACRQHNAKSIGNSDRSESQLPGKDIIAGRGCLTQSSPSEFHIELAEGAANPLHCMHIIVSRVLELRVGDSPLELSDTAVTLSSMWSETVNRAWLNSSHGSCKP